MQFESLEQRMLHTYLDTFPPFVPLRTKDVSEEAQRQLHTFFERMYRAFADDPSIWFPELHEDDAYPNRFNRSSYGKPKLIVNMRKVLRTIDSFLGALYSFGLKGHAEGNALVLEDTKGLSRKHRAAMVALGLKLENSVLSHDGYPDMFAAWEWMAKRPGASTMAFSRCMFDPEHSYTSDVFRRLSGSEDAFDMLERYLLETGHQRVDCREGRMTLDYVKCRGDAGAEVGNFAYDRNYTGFTAEYEQVIESPQCFALRILRMREIVPMFGRMDDELKDLVIKTNRRCDMCGYCVQRNKNRSSASKHFYVTVEHRGRRYRLCPLFPGHNYWWTSLNEERVKGIIAFLSFVERELFADDVHKTIG